MLRALVMPTQKNAWRKLGLNLNGLDIDIWAKAIAGLDIAEALVSVGQLKLAVVELLAVGKQIRPKFWYSNKEGLLCGENELSFSSQADLMRGWGFSVRYLG